MSGGGEEYNGGYIGCKYEFGGGGSVEEENELVFGVGGDYSSEGFEGEPSDAFEFVGEEQSCVYGYNQWISDRW